VTFNSLKDLKNLIKLCRQTGVNTIKINGIELELGPEPHKAAKAERYDVDPMATLQVPIPNIQDPIAAAKAHAAAELAKIQDYIETDEMTEDQKLFYSSRVEPGQDSPN